MKEKLPDYVEEDQPSESQALFSPEIPVSGMIPIPGLRPPVFDLKTGEEVIPGNFSDPAIAKQIVDIANDEEHILAKLEESQESGKTHTKLKWVLGGAVLFTVLGTAAYVENMRGGKDLKAFRDKALELAEKLQEKNK